jgi:hypothetical protein
MGVVTKVMFRAAVKPLRCAVRAARKPRVTFRWSPVRRMRLTRGGCGQNFLFCTPRHMTLRNHLCALSVRFMSRTRVTKRSCAKSWPG